jgi:alcohol dehydrogenase class IV
VALLLANPGDPLDYLEVVGRGLSAARPALPCIAIPTTAGTGSEVTRNAVLASSEHRVKVSLRDVSMLPKLAIVDSELTLSVPPRTTAATGLDALTQCIEPYLSCLANPLTDGIALEGIRHGARCLRRAYADGNDIEARTGMALTSLFGGLALANAKLGAVHGLAGPVGGMCEAPHGAVCARLLPLVFAANLAALRQRDAANPALVRMKRVAELLLDDPTATADAAIGWLETLVIDLAIPGLAHFGLTESELPDLVAKAQRASSMKGNPLPLTPDELHAIAAKAL